MSPARRPPTPRWPPGLLGALALCLAVETWVARVDGDSFTTVGAAAWGHSSSTARRASSGVIGFGDSLVKHGVLPAVLENRLGRPAINLAMPWGQAPGQDALLRRILRNGGRPEALLIDGELLGDDPAGRSRVWPELLSLFECAELAAKAGDPGLLGELALASLLPSVRARADIRASVLAALSGRSPPDVLAVPVHRRTWRRNLGAEPLPVVDPLTVAVPSGTSPREGWSCHPVNAIYVERFLSRAGARGIPVFWLLPPCHPGVQAIRERNGRDASYVAFVRDLAARHKHVTVVDARRSGYPPEAMADLTHLNRQGAAAFSAGLAEVIAGRLAPGGRIVPTRWAELPRWRAEAPAEVEAAVALEDLRQSAEGFAQRRR